MNSLRAGRYVIASAFAAFFLCALGAAQAQTAPDGKQLTVERIYGAPSLSGSPLENMKWKPDGKHLTYFRPPASTGKTELWEMDAASGEQHQLIDGEKLAALLGVAPTPTQRTGLGRLEPERYIWSPDGSSLLFIRDDNLVLFDLRTKSSKQLLLASARVKDPKFSPDGRWVSFVRGHNLWVINVSSLKESQITRGGNEDFLEGDFYF